MEAKEIMASDKNILKPGSGEPTVTGKLLDIILGCYWMTKEVAGDLGEGKYFSSPNDAIMALDFGLVAYCAKIKVLATTTQKYAEFKGGTFETTVGRLLFNSVLPSDFPYINKEVNRKYMASMVSDLIEKVGMETVAPILDKIKAFGFRFATKSGTTWGIDDIMEPVGKNKIIEAAKKEADGAIEQYNMGFLSKDERL